MKQKNIFLAFIGALLFIAVNLFREVHYYNTIVHILSGKFEIVKRGIYDTGFTYFSNKVLRLVILDLALYLVSFAIYKDKNTRKFILYFIFFQWLILIPIYLLLHINLHKELEGFLTNFRLLLFNGFLTIVLFMLLLPKSKNKSKTAS